RPWPYHEPTETDAELAYWVDWLDLQQRIQMMWVGRLEGVLATLATTPPCAGQIAAHFPRSPGPRQAAEFCQEPARSKSRDESPHSREGALTFRHDVLTMAGRPASRGAAPVRR
ncbi:MAG: hypothetical protein ACM3U2_23265, partial [Deltaproteobacteria bacterium]